MNWTHAKPIAIFLVTAIAASLTSGGMATSRERSKGVARAEIAKRDCDSTRRVVEAERNLALARVDSIIHVVQIRELRQRVYRERAQQMGASSSVSAHASASGHSCGCGAYQQPQKQSFLSRWAPPLVGLAAGIAIGHSWAPDAANTVVNVIANSSSSSDSRAGGHFHGKRWEPRKTCGDRRWHGRGKHRK